MVVVVGRGGVGGMASTKINIQYAWVLGRVQRADKRVWGSIELRILCEMVQR